MMTGSGNGLARFVVVLATKQRPNRFVSVKKIRKKKKKRRENDPTLCNTLECVRGNRAEETRPEVTGGRHREKPKVNHMKGALAPPPPSPPGRKSTLVVREGKLPSPPHGSSLSRRTPLAWHRKSRQKRVTRNTLSFRGVRHSSHQLDKKKERKKKTDTLLLMESIGDGKSFWETFRP